MKDGHSKGHSPILRTIAIVNMIICIIAKPLYIFIGSSIGPSSIVVTGLLWAGIYQKKRWAKYGYYVVSLWMIIASVYSGAVLCFAFSARSEYWVQLVKQSGITLYITILLAAIHILCCSYLSRAWDT